jgi:hypothetical protein
MGGFIESEKDKEVSELWSNKKALCRLRQTEWTRVRWPYK